MPDARTLARPRTSLSGPQWLCASEALVERGSALVFDVQLWGEPARAFAMRFNGRVVAYLNRCAHVPAELDWQPGKFLDQAQRWIVCAFHGATYEPSNGQCVAGPCRGERLMALQVFEQEGQVCWLPTADLQPASTTGDVHRCRP